MAKMGDILKDIADGKIESADDFMSALNRAGWTNHRSLYSGDNPQKLMRERGYLQQELSDNSGFSRFFNQDLKRHKRELTELRDVLADIQEEKKKAETSLSGSERAFKTNFGVDDELITKIKEARDEEEIIDALKKEGLTVDKGHTEALDAAKDIHDKNIELIKVQNKELYQQNRIQQEQNRIREEGWRKAKEGFGQMKQATMDLTKQWVKVDEAASKFSKTMGMSAQGMASLRKSTINAVNDLGLGAKYNAGADEIIQMQQSYLGGIGRNVTVTNGDLEHMAAMSAVMGEQGGEMAARLENFGLSYVDAAQKAGKMFQTAEKYGLNFQKYSENFAKNLSLAQNYTFKNGLKGLEDMARKATAIKLDMSQIAAFAEKVSTLQGAVETGANLQVLGGPFAQFSNPLGMLNEGLNDMEGLMDRFKNMVGGLGKLNTTTGEVEVSSFNKQRIKAAAQAMGMDYSQVMESVNAQARQNFISRQISNSDYNDQQKEFIKNTATIKNGQAVLTRINAEGDKEDVNIKNLNEDELNELIAQNQSESADIKDIAQNLRSITEEVTGGKKQAENKRAQLAEKFLPEVKNLISKVIENPTLIGIAAFLPIGFSMLAGAIKTSQGLGQMIGGGGSGSGGGFFGNIFGKGAKGGKGLFGKLGNVASKVGNLGKSFGSFTGSMGGATTAMGALAGVAAGGAIFAAGKMITNDLVKNDKIKKGGLADFGLRIGTGAAGGALAGASVAGPVGAAVGAIVGAVKGTCDSIGDKTMANIEKLYGVKVNGIYGVSKASQIKKALKTGEISDNIRAKLMENGDTEILDLIDDKHDELEVKKQKEAEIVAKRMEAVKVSAGKDGEIKHKMELSPLKIDLTGTITLANASGNEVDITKELLKDPVFVRNITKKIEEQIINNTKGGNVVQKGLYNV